VFPAWKLEVADGATEWTRDIFQHRLGREFWWPLLLALLALLLVESMVAATGRNASRADATRDSATDTPAPSLAG
jgi:hypothetical protein